MRAITRVLAAVVAAALVVVGVVGLIELVLAAAGRDPWLVPHDEWAADLRQTPWRDDSVVIAGIVLVAIGLLLLVTQLIAMVTIGTITTAGPRSSVARCQARSTAPGTSSARTGTSTETG